MSNMLPEVLAMNHDQRLAKGRCPECGVSLEGLDIRGHRSVHFSKRPVDDGSSIEALHVWTIMEAAAAKQAQRALLSQE